jgi:hypothetical protein
VAREVIGRNLLPRRRAFTETDVCLGLVPAARSADLAALIGWTGPANAFGLAELSAVLRSWEQRFGARVVALLDELYVSVAAPPLRWDHAEHLTLSTCWCARTACRTWWSRPSRLRRPGHRCRPVVVLVGLTTGPSGIGPLAGRPAGDVSASPMIMDAAAARAGAKCHRSV